MNPVRIPCTYAFAARGDVVYDPARIQTQLCIRSGPALYLHGMGRTDLKTLILAVAAAAFAGAFYQSGAIAQGANQGYVTDTRNEIVKTPFGLCVRTGFWSPAMAIAECDPDLVPKAAPAPRPAAPIAPPPPAPAPFKPAPAKPAAKPAPKRCDVTVTLQAGELFAFDKSALTNAAKSRLDKDVIGRIAGSCATLEAAVVEGHTDRLGSQQYNQKLSERRADAVKAYLVSKGVPAARIETIGMGKTVPAKFCPDVKSRKELIACLAPNRRAIISIKGPGK